MLTINEIRANVGRIDTLLTEELEHIADKYQLFSTGQLESAVKTPQGYPRRILGTRAGAQSFGGKITVLASSISVELVQKLRNVSEEALVSLAAENKTTRYPIITELLETYWTNGKPYIEERISRVKSQLPDLDIQLIFAPLNP